MGMEVEGSWVATLRMPIPGAGRNGRWVLFGCSENIMHENGGLDTACSIPHSYPA